MGDMGIGVVSGATASLYDRNLATRHHVLPFDGADFGLLGEGLSSDIHHE